MPADLRRFRHPLLTTDLVAAVVRQLETEISIYDNGGIYAELERVAREKFNAPFILSVNSGTSAILSMYHALGLEPGSEVIVPAYNFFAAAAPLLALGLVPVLADCTRNGNLCPASAAACIGPRTAAISVTHIWGVPAEMGVLTDLATRYGLALVEDASHAHGARFNGRVVGTIGRGGAWSLQGKKIIAAGEGGLFATNDAVGFQRAVLLGHFNRRAKAEVSEPSLRRFATTGTGLNLRMHPLGAALALSQLEDLDRQLRERREVAHYLCTNVAKIVGLRTVDVPREAEPAWYAFPIIFDEEAFGGTSREHFVSALHSLGAIEVDIPRTTRPLSDFPLFRVPHEAVAGYPRVPCREPRDLPGAYWYHQRVFKLPVWYGPLRMEYAHAYVAALQEVAASIGVIP